MLVWFVCVASGAGDGRFDPRLAKPVICVFLKLAEQMPRCCKHKAVWVWNAVYRPLHLCVSLSPFLGMGKFGLPVRED